MKSSVRDSEGTGHRPPAEHRVAGIDRRTIVPALIALGVVVLWAFLVPAVDGALGYDEETRAGDVLIIGPASTMALPAGWGLRAGLRTPDRSRTQDYSSAETKLESGSVIFTTKAGVWKQSAAALTRQTIKDSKLLQSQAKLRIKNVQRTFSTNSGNHGAIQDYQTVSGQGTVVAFVKKGVGIQVVISGPAAAMAQRANEIGAMLASINVGGAEDLR